MATLMLLLFSLAITVVLAVAFSCKSYAKKPSSNPKIPPGSMGWPLIGEYLSFTRSHPSSTLGSFMDDHISRYGKIFTTNLFGKMTVISADAELNQFILNNDTTLFGQGWPPHFEEIAGSSAMTFVTGDAHKRQRSCLLNFFATSSLEKFLCGYANELAAELVSSWKANDIISAKKAAIEFTFDIAVKRAMSMRSGAPETRKLLKEFENYIAGLFSLPLKFPGTPYQKARQAASNIEKAIEYELEKRRKNNGDSNTKMEQEDILSHLVNDGSYSSKQILYHTRDAIGAAYMSTSRMIPVVIYYLGKFPKALYQLRDEHLQMIQCKGQQGEHKLTWEDCKQLQFTNCVINEALRLGSTVMLPKKAMSDIEYKGYVIPQGWTIMTHISAMHLDPLVFEEPEIFNPWRWLNSSGYKMSKNFIPFGRGARQCLGSELTKLEITVFLHHLIMKYKWAMVTSEYPLSVPHISFPKGLQIKLQEWSQ